MSKQQEETVTMALLMLFFSPDDFTVVIIILSVQNFFLAFVNKQNFKRLRDTHLSGRKRHGQPRLHFLGLLVSLEGGFQQIILL